MPRPQKIGIDYFPLDVNIFDNKEKIKPIIAKFSADGVAFLIYLYCEIYKNGYYIKFDDDYMDIASMDLRVSKNKIRQMLSYFIKRSLFDGTLFHEVTVLTSRGIQERYMYAIKERARKNKAPILVKEKYWLIPESEILEVNVKDGNVLTCIKVIHFLDIPRKNKDIPRKNKDIPRKNDLKESKVKNLNYIYNKAFSSQELRETFEMYINCRIQKGENLSPEQVMLLIKDLKAAEAEEHNQLKIVRKAVINGWKTFYSLPVAKKETREVSTTSHNTNKFNNFEGRQYNYDDLEKKLLG